MNVTEEQIKKVWANMPQVDKQSLIAEYGILAEPLFIFWGTKAPLTEAGKKLLEEHGEKAS